MPEPAFTISQLDLAEIERVEPVWNALREHHAEMVGIDARARADAWSRRRSKYACWLGEPGNYALIATTVPGDDVGYAVVTEFGAEITFPSERVATLETLAVLPEARGTGIGSALLDEVRRRATAAGIPELSITAFAANTPALAFYARHGFAPYLQTLKGPTA